jgi:ABC-type phosphate transport system ATPase subunit
MRKNITLIYFINKFVWLKKQTNDVTKIPFWSGEAKSTIVKTVSELNTKEEEKRLMEKLLSHKKEIFEEEAHIPNHNKYDCTIKTDGDLKLSG